MTTLEERFQNGQAMRESMSGGDRGHFTLPGTDQLAPDLKRIIDEALFGSIWTRPGLDLKYRCICTVAALMAMGQLPLLKRSIERCLNVGVTPAQVVEVFIQMTFYVGVPSVEASMRLAREIFEEKGIQFTPTVVYDTSLTAEELNTLGVEVHRQHMGDITTPDASSDPDSPEMQLEELINQYHWGAIYHRPHLDDKARAICAISSMTVLGRYDRQIRRRISGALKVGMTPEEIMEVFIQLTMYGGYFTTRTAMQIARSVFTEEGVKA